jgi:hypothetical protein
MIRVSIATILCCATLAASSETEKALQLAGKAAESFWSELPMVSCAETVRQEKLDARGKPVDHQESTFDYLALMQTSGNEVVVEESRVPTGAPADRKDISLLVTSGFSTFALIFHPVFQDAFEYAPPEAVAEGGRRLLKVDFRHVHGARSPSALRLRGHDYPVEWRGSAWIDAESGALTRIVAELEAPMDDLGLKSLIADVRYAPVTFSASAAPYWLPEQATIELQTPRQHWRNTHLFSKYRVFSVDVTEETKAPK